MSYLFTFQTLKQRLGVQARLGRPIGAAARGGVGFRGFAAVGYRGTMRGGVRGGVRGGIRGRGRGAFFRGAMPFRGEGLMHNATNRLKEGGVACRVVFYILKEDFQMYDSKSTPVLSRTDYLYSAVYILFLVYLYSCYTFLLFLLHLHQWTH